VYVYVYVYVWWRAIIGCGVWDRGWRW
jgi:hypothetical protein